MQKDPPPPRQKGERADPNMIKTIAMYVATLSRKLDALLSFSYGVYVLSEVRVPHTAMPGIMCATRAKGFGAVFSHSPPATSTLAASEGVGVLVREPYKARKMHVAVLKRWEELGRVVACVMTSTETVPLSILWFLILSCHEPCE